MNILEVAMVLEKVGNTPSKTEKQDIIATYKEDTLFQKVLNHIFNISFKTNIGTKKLGKEVKELSEKTIANIDEYMEYLSNCTGKSVQIVTVQEYIKSQPEEIAWLLEAMATKTLKLGFTQSTINKAFGYKFLPDFNPMLAERYVDIKKKPDGTYKRHDNWERYLGKKVIGTKKLDGNRLIAFNKVTGVEFFSREGLQAKGLVELEEAFRYYPTGLVYDGEVLANEEGLNTQQRFSKTNSIMKTDGDKVGLNFHAFDVVPIDDFENEKYDTSCLSRKNALEKIVNIHSRSTNLIEYVYPIFYGEFDKEKIDSLADKAKKNGEEGIMIQLADSGYQFKRCFDILKCKAFESADLRCLDVYEGKSGKNIGKLGGVVLDFKGERVNVGGGFSDEERESIWKDKDLVLDKIIEIKYFEESRDKHGNLDLRFATFKTVRDDKTEPSYY